MSGGFFDLASQMVLGELISSLMVVSNPLPLSYNMLIKTFYIGIDKRGMVVRVYCAPERGAGELIDFENGLYGKYFE